MSLFWNSDCSCCDKGYSAKHCQKAERHPTVCTEIRFSQKYVTSFNRNKKRNRLTSTSHSKIGKQRLHSSASTQYGMKSSFFSHRNNKNTLTSFLRKMIWWWTFWNHYHNQRCWCSRLNESSSLLCYSASLTQYASMENNLGPITEAPLLPRLQEHKHNGSWNGGCAPALRYSIENIIRK